MLVLIYFTPPLAEFALRFGPAELFWVAILGGLFAIPQVLTMLETAKRGAKAEMFNMEQHSVLSSLRYNLGRLKALCVGSVAGIIVGVIPGAGGQISGLIAYDQTKKLSKHKERFGKGEPDGLIAAESANNAMWDHRWCRC